MIKILDNTKTLPQLVADTSGGIGSLDVIDATVTEELNGIYEAEFKILCSEKYYSALSIDSILKVPVNEAGEEQLFRVYYISPEINGMVLVKLQHITYDLSKVVVEPFTATGAVVAKNYMLSHIMGTYPFTMTTDIDNNTSVFKLDIPRSFRECLGGYEGSLLDVFRGEYEWDNLTVKMLARRGSDNGVRIAYGKNLTDFKQETNNESMYTAVLGYAVVNDVTYYGDIYHKLVVAYPKVKIVDFSSDYEMEDVPTSQELTAKAQSYAENNSIEIPKVNITVSFVPLYQTEEYKNIAPLERVRLGDTVHIAFEKLGVEASSRVVKTVWNINTEKYDSIELGNTKASLNSVIDDSIDQAKSDIMKSIEDTDVSHIEEELNTMSSLIVNGLGLHKTVDASGRIYLHNEETLAASKYQYVITAQGFMVSDNYGQTWNSGWDTSGNAVVNALSTIILKALEIHGSVIVFGEEDDKYITAYPYSDSNNNPLGVIFEGTGEIRMQPEGRFEIDNKYNDVIYNQMFLIRSASEGTGNRIYFSNKDLNGATANYMQMAANRSFNTSYGNANYFAQQNYDYDDPTKTSNYINFISTSADSEKSVLVSRNAMFLFNRKKDNNTANSLSLSAYSTGDSLSIYNYNYNSNLSANEILMVSSVTNNEDYTSLNVNNKRPGTSAYANQMNMKATASETSAYLSNNKYGGTIYANRIGMISNSSQNDAFFMNYKRDVNGLANKIEFLSDGTKNSIELNNRKYDTATSDAYYANSVVLNAESSETYLEMRNMNYSLTNVANDLKFSSSSSGNSVVIENRDTSGVVKNSLELSSNETATLWSSNDLRLRSGGAVRLTANYNTGNNQDIWLEGTTIHCYFTSKFSFHKGSQRFNCDFSGMEVGTSYPLYVTRVN